MRKVIGYFVALFPVFLIFGYMAYLDAYRVVYVVCGTVLVVDAALWVFWFIAVGVSIIDKDTSVWKWGGK